MRSMPKHQPGGLGFSVGVFLNLSSQKFRLCESTEFSLLATAAQLLAPTSIAKDYEPLRQKSCRSKYNLSTFWPFEKYSIPI